MDSNQQTDSKMIAAMSALMPPKMVMLLGNRTHAIGFA
jgi:hypothetical protein